MSPLEAIRCWVSPSTASVRPNLNDLRPATGSPEPHRTPALFGCYFLLVPGFRERERESECFLLNKHISFSFEDLKRGWELEGGLNLGPCAIGLSLWDGSPDCN